MRNMNFRKILVAMIITSLFIPQLSYAVSTSEFEVTGWVPYWKAEKGAEKVVQEIDVFTEVNPFIYTVKTNGMVNQADYITDPEWVRLRDTAERENVRFIPTIMWADKEAIHDVLSDPEKRKAHIHSIVQEIYRYGYDGIDIDYENKMAETNPYFSLFLKELYEAVGVNKWIMCTIEPRMPLEARYLDPEEKLELLAYANDFDAINTYCDRVRVMTYDQGRADVQLVQEHEHPYIPVADTEWVRKVIEFMSQDIDTEKMLIGIATYGYEYDMYKTDTGSTNYSRLWSFSHTYAVDLAQKIGIDIERGVSGEAQLVFPAASSTEPELPRPDATRVVVWSDAQAIEEKVELARELGLRGVSLFRIDSGEDPEIWNMLRENPKGDAVPGAQKPIDLGLARDSIVKDKPSGGTAITLSMPQYDLEYGMRNEDVRTLQRFLNNNGLLVAASGPGSLGNETTFFGPATKSALARYQELHGITPAVGYYGPLTRSMIQGG